jgi:CheY-like chemotaxis protein
MEEFESHKGLQNIKMDEFQNLKGLLILIAEDNAINRLLWAVWLKRMGVPVHIAANGAIAVEMLSKDLYDVVLMDIQMPVMNGYEAASAIRAKGGEYFRNLPILALAVRPDLEKIEACGMNGYIYTCPVDFERLHKVLSTYLKK